MFRNFRQLLNLLAPPFVRKLPQNQVYQMSLGSIDPLLWGIALIQSLVFLGPPLWNPPFQISICNRVQAIQLV